MKYAYVICFVHPTNKEPPSFAHTFVEADNKEEAYSLGFKRCAIKRAQAQFLDRPWNDYVFPLPSDTEEAEHCSGEHELGPAFPLEGGGWVRACAKCEFFRDALDSELPTDWRNPRYY